MGLRSGVRMMQGNSNFRTTFATMISAAFSLLSFFACAQGAGPSASEPALSAGFRFYEMSGEELLANVCRACHMSDGKSAEGAGSYPSLAGNMNLQVSGYPLDVVVNGRSGKPPFGVIIRFDEV